MYVRRVKKRNGSTKKVYEYLHLVESVRTEKGPRQRLILNLGNLDIHPSQYKAFAQRVEDILIGQKSFITLDSKIEKHAQNASRQIFKKQAKEISDTVDTNYQNVDVNSLETEFHRSLGAEYLCHCIWNELKMSEFFIRQGISRHVIPLLKALVIGRLIEPGSERYTKEWAEKCSAIFELAGFPLRPSLNSYYRAGDKLFSIKDNLENHLSVSEKNLFSLKEKVFFFDLTNTYFEGESLDNPKAKRGKSKEKRSDCKLVTLALIIDKFGFCKYSKLFPGNRYEGNTLADMIKGLQSHLSTKAKDLTIVIDAGIATDENIEWLKGRHYHYIAVNRGNLPFKEDYSGMQVIKEDVSKGIKIEVKRFTEDGEIYILCKSQGKVAKEKSIRTRAERLFLERLSYYKAGLSLPRRTKKYRRILEFIGRLKEKYSKAAKLYTVRVIPEKDKPATDSHLLTTDIIWSKKTEFYEGEVAREGSYVLRTNRLDLTDKEIWGTYIMLTRIEYAFMSMKSTLGLRPNFHQIENRVDTHMFISVLAYHILHIIEYRLRQKGDHRKWTTIRNVLKTHERLTIAYKSRDEYGNILQQYMRVNSKLEPEHLAIYRMFNLSGIPLPRKKFSRK